MTFSITHPDRGTLVVPNGSFEEQARFMINADMDPIIVWKLFSQFPKDFKYCTPENLVVFGKIVEEYLQSETKVEFEFSEKHLRAEVAFIAKLIIDSKPGLSLVDIMNNERFEHLEQLYFLLGPDELDTDTITDIIAEECYNAVNPPK